MVTAFHAKYFAHELTRRHGPNDTGRLSQSLFDASVDLNPHQIEAALFALKSPLSKGVLLADEVGLGKTIEAGIVLCQFWAERRRRLLVICPASLRKQWALELEEKFNLPTFVLDARTGRELRKKDQIPLSQKAIIILSYHYANKIRDELKAINWNLVVIDEAHKLRNAYRESNKIGQSIRWATQDCRKLLLTATPLQNSLLELYGLSTLIDEHLFGDVNAFRSQYVSTGGDLDGLRLRLSGFCRRTLRNQVTEYIRYTERRTITQPFRPTDDEHQLYEAVSAFLLRPESYAIPHRQRHLIELILRKLLASSSLAIAGTLETMKTRLEIIRDEKQEDETDLAKQLIDAEEIEADLLDEILDSDAEEENSSRPAIKRKQLEEEISLLAHLIERARSIGTDTKTGSLLTALEVGFQQMTVMGAQHKALIFTESRRTQMYLARFLEANGYAGQIVQFSGVNNSPQTTAIYDAWLAENQDSGRVTGSRDIDIRMALIEHFRDSASIMIATEAAAEGVNIQFCSLVINYDLPWNPQRVEQRIGRCHRYGQLYDVVVINFLNERNHADRRVLELLTEKFNLFSGVFGASDEVLGSIESGVDFEKRILTIYQECRTPEQIEVAFKQLQQEMDERIQERMQDTRRMLLENFDEDVHERLRMQLNDAKAQLDRFSKRFWALTQFMLHDRAQFDDQALTFDLTQPPKAIAAGRYHLISKTSPRPDKLQISEQVTQLNTEFGSFLYRLSHPLGEYVIDQARILDTPYSKVIFDVTQHPVRLHQVEALKGKHGYLTLTLLAIDSFDQEEYLLFSAIDEQGVTLEQETCEKLFNCMATNSPVAAEMSPSVAQKLAAAVQRHVQATISQSLEANNRFFNEAREKLENWADDKILAAEKALKDTKEQIKIQKRQARLAANLDEQHEIQKTIQKLEKQQRRQRQEIFQVEDTIIEKRDALIATLERRLSQKTKSSALFTITWEVM